MARIWMKGADGRLDMVGEIGHASRFDVTGTTFVTIDGRTEWFDSLIEALEWMDEHAQGYALSDVWYHDAETGEEIDIWQVAGMEVEE